MHTYIHMIQQDKDTHHICCSSACHGQLSQPKARCMEVNQDLPCRRQKEDYLRPQPLPGDWKQSVLKCRHSAMACGYLIHFLASRTSISQSLLKPYHRDTIFYILYKITPLFESIFLSLFFITEFCRYGVLPLYLSFLPSPTLPHCPLHFTTIQSFSCRFTSSFLPFMCVMLLQA